MTDNGTILAEFDGEPKRDGSAAVDLPKANPKGDRPPGRRRSQNRVKVVRRKSDNELIATYSYDDQSRRVRKVTTSIAAQGEQDRVFLWDNWVNVAEIDHDSGAFNAVRFNAWGPDLSGSREGAGGVGGLVFEKDVSSATVYMPSYDGNGNVVTLVKASDGSVAAEYTYDPFGNVIASTGAYADANPWRFSTKFFDEETTWLYYGYRYYDPETGRWVNRDPIEEAGGVNLYGMVGNDPVGRLDFLGLIEVTDDTGTKCDGICLGRVSIRVQAPSQSVAQQISSDPAKRKLLKDVIDRRATLEALGNGIVTGHTFIWFTYATYNSAEAWGFYPGKQWFGQPGQIVDDLNHSYTKQRFYRVCSKKIDELKKLIDADKISPPIYSLTDLQCTTWAVGEARAIGIKDLPATACEPFTLGEEFDKLPVPPFPKPTGKK